MSEQRMIGDILYERRSRLGLSLDRVVSDTKLQRRVVEAFERSDFEAMPPKGYAQATLASYARYLDLDQNEILRVYESQLYHHKRVLREVATRGVRDDERPASRAQRSSRAQRPARDQSERRGPAATSRRSSQPAYREDPYSSSRARRTSDLYATSSSARHEQGYGREHSELGEHEAREARPYGRDARASGRTPRRETEFVTLDDGYQGGSGGTGSYPPAPGSLLREREALTRSQSGEEIRDALSGILRGVCSYLRDNRAVTYVVAAIVLLLLVILVIFGVTSCASRSGSDSGGTIPVSSVGSPGSDASASSDASATQDAVAEADQAVAVDAATTVETANAIDLNNLPYASVVTFTVSPEATESPWIEVTADDSRVYASQTAPGGSGSYTIGYSCTITTNLPDLVAFAVNGTQVQPVVENGTATLSCYVAADQQGPLEVASDMGVTDEAADDGSGDTGTDDSVFDENGYSWPGLVEVYVDAEGTPYYYGPDGYERYCYADGSAVTA